jgi:hypothetical protein
MIKLKKMDTDLNEPLAKKRRLEEANFGSRLIDITDKQCDIRNIFKNVDAKFYEFIDDSNVVTETRCKFLELEPCINDILDQFVQSYIYLVKTFYPNYKI